MRADHDQSMCPRGFSFEGVPCYCINSKELLKCRRTPCLVVKIGLVRFLVMVCIVGFVYDDSPGS
mgnify:FL=1